MSSPRPILFTLLLLLSLSIPLALYSLFTVLARLYGSHTYALLASLAGLLTLATLLPTLLFFFTYLLHRLTRRPKEFEFGIEPPTCPSCGYDLRASPDHCPECGHPVPPLDRTIIQYLIRLRRKP